MGFQNPIVGGTALRIPAIQSPNYVPGVSGWIIKIDGSAEFNNLVVRGQFSGTDFIIDANGIFFYAGTPATGNLTGSWTAAAGTDGFGNAYQAGITLYGASTAINLFDNDITLTASNGTTAVLESGLNAALYLTPAGGPWFAGAVNSGVGGGSHPLMSLFSPSDTTNGVQASFVLQGSSTASVQTSILAVATFMSLTGTMKIFGAGQIRDWWIKQDNSGNALTWQTPGYAANWAASTTFNGSTSWSPLQYRLDAEDNLWLVGAFKATGAVTNPVFNLPAGYRPATQWPLVCQQNVAGTLTMIMAEIGSSGNVNLLTQNGGNLANGHEYLINARIPMGNIA